MDKRELLAELKANPKKIRFAGNAGWQKLLVSKPGEVRVATGSILEMICGRS
jgi:hypothetical protein